MMEIRKAKERGYFNHGWLETWHSFSFGDYWDPKNMGFRSLRVINEDFVAPGQGFGTHPHRDMEIITYVLEGSIAHKDSMGTGSTISPGDVQRMSAGTGVTHSEFNPSKDKSLHLLQIWIQPESSGLAPGYEQKNIPAEEKRDRLRLVASRDGREGSVTIHQDADLFAAILSAGASVEHPFEPGRFGYLQVIRGAVIVNGTSLAPGDGLKLSQEASAKIVNARTPGVDSEILLFDLP